MLGLKTNSWKTNKTIIICGKLYKFTLLQKKGLSWKSVLIWVFIGDYTVLIIRQPSSQNYIFYAWCIGYCQCHYHDSDLSNSLVIQNGELVNITDCEWLIKPGERSCTVFIISARHSFPPVPASNVQSKSEYLAWDFRNALTNGINVVVYLLAIPNLEHVRIVFSFSTDVFTAVTHREPVFS